MYLAEITDWQQFAEYIGVRDPRNKRRSLRLDELVDKDYVREAWFPLRQLAISAVSNAWS